VEKVRPTTLSFLPPTLFPALKASAAVNSSMGQPTAVSQIEKLKLRRD
jgi:hypothetical protein